MPKVTPNKSTKVKSVKTEEVENNQTVVTQTVQENIVPEVSVPEVSVPEVSVPEVTTVLSSENTEDVNSEFLFNKLITQFQDIQTVMKTLHFNLKVLQKEVLREKKESKKKEGKIKKKSDKKRSPSGFAKPAFITNELANFLGLPNGTELARTEVTSKVIAYVKEKNLQNPEMKKEIIPDEKLSKLLEPSDGDVITFFNLQTYLKKHFINTTLTSTVTSTVV